MAEFRGHALNSAAYGEVGKVIASGNGCGMLTSMGERETHEIP